MRWLSLWMLAAAPLLAAAQAPLTLELLSPRDDPARTTAESVNLLGRTLPGTVVRVGGELVTVFATGVFARDRVPLTPGFNTLHIEARGADGQTLSRQWQIERVSPPPSALWPADRLWLDGASLQPAQTLQVAPGEGVEVSLRATPQQRVEARLPGQTWRPLVETSTGRYRAWLVFGDSQERSAAPVQVRVSALALPRLTRPRRIGALTAGTAGLWRIDPERLFVVGPEGAALVQKIEPRAQQVYERAKREWPWVGVIAVWYFKPASDVIPGWAACSRSSQCWSSAVSSVKSWGASVITCWLSRRLRVSSCGGFKRDARRRYRLSPSVASSRWSCWRSVCAAVMSRPMASLPRLPAFCTSAVCCSRRLRSPARASSRSAWLAISVNSVSSVSCRSCSPSNCWRWRADSFC